MAVGNQNYLITEPQKNLGDKYGWYWEILKEIYLRANERELSQRIEARKRIRNTQVGNPTTGQPGKHEIKIAK